MMFLDLLDFAEGVEKCPSDCRPEEKGHRGIGACAESYGHQGRSLRTLQKANIVMAGA